MHTYFTFLWLAVVIIAIYCEAMTAALVSIWFIPAALVSMIMAMCKVAFAYQMIVFGVLSLLMIILFRVFFRKNLKIKDPKATNTDLLIGSAALVVEDIDNILEKGAAKINGQVWSARSTDENEKILAGTRVTVVAISGVKLICKKITE